MKEIDLKIQGKIKRLTNKTFKFDSRVKDGWYSAVYFLKTAQIVRKYKPDSIVTMQFFQREDAVLCGIDEAIALLHTFSINPHELQIEALHDGDFISPMEPVLKVTGHYQNFGYLENLIDGILARRTSVATNVYRAVKAAEGRQIMFFGDRDDHFTNQAGDGYSAYIGGIAAQCTNAMNEWWGMEGVGTMPHALIQMFEGDLVAASKAYIETYPNDNFVALVDFNNDVITDSLKVAREFGDKLYGVRVDTSISLKDKYFDTIDYEKLGINPYGVNPELIFALRKALDDEGFNHVKIIVSSGFNEKKIKEFVEKGVPVDTFGVGKSLLRTFVSFTGDCVMLNGKELAKFGRRHIPSERLEKVDYPVNS
ncbi:TPA: nicotinate phosphoribosyltransferase [bacterium]|jgi:nicotinate phosphoribosyltransferase|nr:nicotinate phosphoribosyltransferase [bacterium]